MSIIYFELIACLYLQIENCANTADGLRKKVVKTDGELTKLMSEYELAGVVVINAPSCADMFTWLATDRPRRRATIPPS